ncbi:phage portal protein [Parelusimicrobium proximum]|uniref:phage portal protein n=1 Tax=Parelusimicrobium proximum TaxID=3228953 RepID=UPI003D167BAF
MNIFQKLAKIVSTSRESKSFLSPSVVELTGSKSSLPSPDGHNYSPYVESYSDRAWVYICVSAVSEAVSGADFVLKNAKGEIVREHPVLSLLYKPNTFMSGRSLREWIISSLELTGNAYILKDSLDKYGRPRELFPLISHLVEIVPNQNAYEPVMGYKYRAGSKTAYYRAEDIIHFKYFNPNDFFYGLSPVAAARHSLDAISAAESYNKSFFDNSATLSGILTTEQRLDDHTHSRIIRSWTDKYSSHANAHKVALLEGGLKWQSISMSQRDMDFVEGLKMNRETIMSIFHVPPAIAGVFDSRAQYSTREQQRIFYQTCVLPKQTLILDTLTEFLLPDFDESKQMYFDKDISAISVLREDETERAAAAKIYHEIGFSREEIVEGLGLPFGIKQKSKRKI